MHWYAALLLCIIVATSALYIAIVGTVFFGAYSKKSI